MACSSFQGHAADVFEAYTQLLTEMVLRLPYQIKKIADTNSRIPPPIFDHSWFYFLSEVSENVIHLQVLTKMLPFMGEMSYCRMDLRPISDFFFFSSPLKEGELSALFYSC